MGKGLLVILSDEHQARAMGCAHHPFVQTPNLDALAARGTRFTNAITPSPICVPARAAFASGKYPHQTRHWDNAMPYTGTPRSWGHVLQDAGVRCESIGKLHYRDPGDDVGFDTMHMPMMVVDGIGMVWASVRAEAERAGPRTGRMLGPQIGPGESSYTRYDRDVTDRAARWLRDPANTEGDWCLYVGLVAPHFPLVVPQAFYDLYPPETLPEPKLHPRGGYIRHPWVEKQNAFMDSEARFRDADERRAAMAAYFGLVSWMDHNVGQILRALEAAGLNETTVIYSSDHGDNVGARGLWGKSNFYEESVAVPLIMAGPGVPVGENDSPVSLIDVAATIPAHFGQVLNGAEGAPLPDLIAAPNPERAVFSEYHAAGSVSGGFMLRRGRWKLIRYVGFTDELFDLEADPEELRDLAGDPAYADVRAELRAALAGICDVEAVNVQAFADQDALIARYGGRTAAMALGAPGATPPPAR